MGDVAVSNRSEQGSEPKHRQQRVRFWCEPDYVNGSELPLTILTLTGWSVLSLASRKKRNFMPNLMHSASSAAVSVQMPLALGENHDRDD
jgi:hypothetical protein